MDSENDNPPWLVMPRAIVINSPQEAPVAFFMARPASNARKHMPIGPDFSTLSSIGVRTIRCGIPSSFVVTMMSSVVAAR